VLSVSEQFYSIQGEGPFTGMPAIFLRLSGCNLLCGGQDSLKSKQPENGATWRCDTIEVWLKGQKQQPEAIIQDWKHKQWLQHLKAGAHVVITGGEPLLQQKGCIEFLIALKKELGSLPCIEFETNGSIVPDNALLEMNCHFNISPKSSNSGMLKAKRFNKEALTRFNNYTHSHFKFVVSALSDINEIKQDFIKPLSIAKEKISLMPAACSKEQLEHIQELIIEQCKANQWRYSTRLHIAVWNKKTGV